MRKVYGKGINDADYLTQPKVNGKQVTCLFYSYWKAMLRRCYSEKHLEKKPTYRGCKVCDDWLVFSNFKKWMEKQDWEGKELDKDIIKEGNKVYSPENCVFVDKAINLIFTDKASTKGRYPAGVSITGSGKFRPMINRYGKRVDLGSYKTVEEARTVYIKAKADYIIDMAGTQQKRVKEGMIRHAKSMLSTLKKGKHHAM